MQSHNKRIYLSPQLEARRSRIKRMGLFAIKPMRKGEIILDLSSRKRSAITKPEADKNYESGFDYMLQIGPDKFLVTVSSKKDEIYGYVNHSCNPNCGIKQSVKIVAMRTIRSGEEVTFDYAMSETSDYSMKCHCGAKQCRKVITGNDWKIKELQKRYRGFFSDYIEKRIK